jgi:hypothetical protein
VTVKGRVYYLGPYGSPKAQAAYARLVARLAAGQTVEPPQSGFEARLPAVALLWP